MKDETRLKHHKSMTLTELCSDIFTLILNIRMTDDLGDEAKLRQRIKEALQTMTKKGLNTGFDPENLKNARFALIAFIDESIIGSNWDQKDYWLANPMQLELFNLNDAGDKFFVFLEKLRNRPHMNTELLEIYYICLCLGFKGKYLIYEQDKLRDTIDELHQELIRMKGKPPEYLSPHGYPREQIREIIQKRIPVWIVCVVAGSIGLLFYIVFSLLITGSANHIADLLKV